MATRSSSDAHEQADAVRRWIDRQLDWERSLDRLRAGGSEPTSDRSAEGAPPRAA